MQIAVSLVLKTMPVRGKRDGIFLKIILRINTLNPLDTRLFESACVTLCLSDKRMRGNYGC